MGAAILDLHSHKDTTIVVSVKIELVEQIW